MFDRCFGQQATNIQVFESIGRPLIQSALKGVNGAVLCYGQTGAGKTFTMFGETEPSALADLEEEESKTNSAKKKKKLKKKAASATTTATANDVDDDDDDDDRRARFENRGLVEQTLSFLFFQRRNGMLNHTLKVDVCVSCLEVYQDRLYDLLAVVKPPSVR